MGSVADDLALWALQRERLDRGDLVSTDLVVLGKSRIQLGFDPARYGERTGDRFVQLALDDRDPLATLEDIAEQSDFSGVVLVAVDASSFEPERHDDQLPWVEYYHSDWRPNPRLNRVISSTLQGRLALLSPLANLLDLFRELYRGRSIRSLYYLETRADRTRAADYHPLPPICGWNRFEGLHPTWERSRRGAAPWSSFVFPRLGPYGAWRRSGIRGAITGIGSRISQAPALCTSGTGPDSR